MVGCFHEAATPTSRRALSARRARRHTVGMEILLNGQTCRIGDDATLDALLREQGLAERRVAIEVNGEIVPRGRHASHVLHPADRVEA